MSVCCVLPGEVNVIHPTFNHRTAPYPSWYGCSNRPCCPHATILLFMPLCSSSFNQSSFCAAPSSTPHDCRQRAWRASPSGSASGLRMHVTDRTVRTHVDVNRHIVHEGRTKVPSAFIKRLFLATSRVSKRVSALEPTTSRLRSKRSASTNSS